MATIFLLFFISGFIPLFLYKKPILGSIVGFGLAFILSILSCGYFIVNINEINSFELSGSFLFSPKFIGSSLENFFAFIVSFISICTSFFAIGYARVYEKSSNLSVFASLYNFFILSMLLVIMSDNVFSFILLWEIMTLISGLLIMINDKKNATKTIMTYLGVAQVGAFCMLIALVLMGSFSGGFTFEDFSNIKLSPMMSNFIFTMLFIGFGSKAGLWPFHFWLKDTYLQAPSNVSALMSGVMIKVGIFAFIKFSLYLPLSAYNAYLLLGVGGVSVLVGALYIAVQNRAKSAIAYSTCENAGIIFLGIGAGVYGVAFKEPSFAFLGFSAALFHTLNHSVFKSLLFLGSGFIYANAKTDDMDKMGGFAKKAPIVAYSFFIGVMAIVAIPPLNGFASEWLTYKSLLQGGHSTLMSDRFFFISSITLLAVGGVVALFAFTKVYGAIFSGMPRDKRIYNLINEDNIYLKYPLLLLAICCVVLAFNFEFIVGFLNHILSSKLLHVNGVTHKDMLNLPLLLLVLISCGVIGYMGLILFRANFKKARLTQPWASGYKYDANMQISSNAFSGDIREIFKFFYRHKTKVIQQDGYFGKVTYESKTQDFIHSWVDRYVVFVACKFAQFLQRFQNGLTNLYTSYILIFLCIMFIYSHYFL